MIIDFHTHVFPDKIAAQTVKHLGELAHITPYTDGSVTGLLESMKESGVTTSVVLPVVTKPSQFDAIFSFAQSLNNIPGIISFAGIHPESEDIEKKLQMIKSAGFKGIKLHPDYQNHYIDDPLYIAIIKNALDLDLIISIHAGIDVGLPDNVRCSPDRALKMINEISGHLKPDSKLILAHTGGWKQWDDVIKYLLGENIYFDISYSLGFISNEQLLTIINKHGSNRILFATDSPWGKQLEYVQTVKQLPLDKESIDNILFKNALTILNL